MSDMLSQLLRAGLVDPDEAIKQEQRQDQTRRDAQPKFKGDRRHADELDSATTVDEFKQIARRVLTEDPSKAQLVVHKAHNFRGERGGSRLVWIMYQVRDGLKNCPADKVKLFLKRALRRANPAFTVPD